MPRSRWRLMLSCVALLARSARADAVDVPGNRSRLLLNHIPKCGGSTLRGLLNSGKLVHRRHLTIRAEFASSTARDRWSHFVVAALRDPCSYYVSAFSYGVRDGSSPRRFYGKLRKIHPDLPRVPNASDTRAFALFVEYAAGCLTSRVWRSLPGLHVDCWIRTGSILADLEGCLGRFHAQGGVLRDGWRDELQQLRAGEAASKAHRNASPHMACERYFDGGAALESIRRYDGAVCELLGGCHCCKQLEPGVVSSAVLPSSIRPTLRTAHREGAEAQACHKTSAATTDSTTIFDYDKM